MEIITLEQPFIGTGKDGEKHIYLDTYLADGKRRRQMNTTEKNFSEMKQAVVNGFLSEGYRAPQNEIAKYITQDGFYKKVKTGLNKWTYSTDYVFDTKFIPGSKLMMTKGK